MAERAVIQASPRTVLGKKVKQLRRAGVLPANVYGRAIPSLALEIDAREFSRNIKATGLRSMFELNIAGEPAPRYVIIRGMTRKGGTGEPIHLDFFQVDPNRPIVANVPIHLVGESPAVRDLAGTLLHSLDIVSVRCLPLPWFYWWCSGWFPEPGALLSGVCWPGRTDTPGACRLESSRASNGT